MLQARKIGNYIQQKAVSKGLGISDLSEELKCTDQKTKSFLKGRTLLSFSQLSRVAELLETPIADVLAGDDEQYNATVVHCMNGFDNVANREMILDIIDEYMDIKDSISD